VPKVEDAQEILERHILNGEKVERLIMKENKAL
jgi:(2Fe-2S) ferredoxin